MQVILFIAALFGVQPFYEQWLGDHDPLTSLRVARSWAEPWMFLTSPSQAACKPSICAVAERMAWNRNDFAFAGIYLALISLMFWLTLAHTIRV
jgi:hypothetical protein